MDELIGIQVHAEAQVERGTATECACGGLLGRRDDGTWYCHDCGKEYA